MLPRDEFYPLCNICCMRSPILSRYFAIIRKSMQNSPFSRFSRINQLLSANSTPMPESTRIHHPLPSCTAARAPLNMLALRILRAERQHDLHCLITDTLHIKYSQIRLLLQKRAHARKVSISRSMWSISLNHYVKEGRASRNCFSHNAPF